MKHGEGRDAARDMYVYQQMTFDEIARRLGRSDKTIRTWAEEENWKVDRSVFIDNRKKVHEKLYLLVDKIADRMINDCESMDNLSPQSLHALTNLVNVMNSSYKYEGQVKATSEQNIAPSNDGISDDTLQKIEKQLALL